MKIKKNLSEETSMNIWGGYFFEVGTEMNWFIGMVLRNLLNSPGNNTGETDQYQINY